MSKTTQIVIVLFCSLLGSLGQIFFKLGSNYFKFNLSLVKNYHIIIGIFLYIIAALLFIYTLRFGEVSILYPVIAMSYVWVLILAKIILHENVEVINFVGAGFILLGVYISII